MSEQAYVNPFLEENADTSGGGVGDGAICTVTKSQFGTYTGEYNGEKFERHEWVVGFVPDGGDNEWTQRWSIGGLVPTADGEGFTKADGTLGVLHKKCAALKAAIGLKAGGFDMNLLFDAKTGKVRASSLVGARLSFKGVDLVDKDGKPKKNKKGYVMQDFFPEKFHGFKEGVGNRAPAGPSADVKAEAQALVTKILAESGPLTRNELLGAISRSGNPNSGAIVTIVIGSTEGQPWKIEDGKYVLAAEPVAA